MRVSLSQGELYFFLCPCLSRLRTSRRHFLVRGQFRFGVRATTPGFRSYGNGYEYWGLLAMVAALPWLGGERGRSKVDRQEYLNTCVGTILSAHSRSRVGLPALLTLSRFGTPALPDNESDSSPIRCRRSRRSIIAPSRSEGAQTASGSCSLTRTRALRGSVSQHRLVLLQGESIRRIAPAVKHAVKH